MAPQACINMGIFKYSAHYTPLIDYYVDLIYYTS